MATTSSDSAERKADAVSLENGDTDREKASSKPLCTPEEQRRVIRKLDFHLMPLCFLLYTFSVLDVSRASPPLPTRPLDPRLTHWNGHSGLI